MGVGGDVQGGRWVPRPLPRCCSAWLPHGEWQVKSRATDGRSIASALVCYPAGEVAEVPPRPLPVPDRQTKRHLPAHTSQSEPQPVRRQPAAASPGRVARREELAVFQLQLAAVPPAAPVMT